MSFRMTVERDPEGGRDVVCKMEVLKTRGVCLQCHNHSVRFGASLYAVSDVSGKRVHPETLGPRRDGGGDEENAISVEFRPSGLQVARTWLWRPGVKEMEWRTRCGIQSGPGWR